MLQTQNSRLTRQTSSSIHTTIVIELGNSYIRVGVSGECTPRHIIPSCLRFPSQRRNTTDDESFEPILSQSDWERILEPLLKSILFDYLLISNLKSFRLIIVHSTLITPQPFQNAIKKLHHNIGVSSLLFIHGSLSSLYANGLDSGLVIDIGRREVHCSAYFDRKFIPGTWKEAPCGWENLEIALFKKINLPSIDDARYIIEQSLHQQQIQKEITKDEAYNRMLLSYYFIINKQQKFATSVIDQIIQELCEEVIYNIENLDSLAYTILLELLSIPVDLRKELLSNIMVIGGGSMILNEEILFESLKEGTHKISKFSILSPLFQKQFEIKKNCFANNLTSWIGASIMGSLSLNF